MKTLYRVCLILIATLALSGLAVVCLTQQKTLAELRAQLSLQQEHLRELNTPQTNTQPVPESPPSDTATEQLRESTKELLRLRNEVTRLRKQNEELEKLRRANADLLQAVQGSRALQSNQLALVSSARKQGAVLGVIVQAAEPGRAGVIVTGVDPTSPVAVSGVMAGDLIFALDGKTIQNPGQLQAEMLTRNPGEVVVVDVLRTNATLRFQVQARAWPQ